MRGYFWAVSSLDLEKFFEYKTIGQNTKLRYFFPQIRLQKVYIKLCVTFILYRGEQAPVLETFLTKPLSSNFNFSIRLE